MQTLHLLHVLPQSAPPTPQPDLASAVSSNGSAMVVPPCFGICCPLHSQCNHYARVEGADPDGVFAEHCGPELTNFEPTQVRKT